MVVELAMMVVSAVHGLIERRIAREMMMGVERTIEVEMVQTV